MAIAAHQTAENWALEIGGKTAAWLSGAEPAPIDMLPAGKEDRTRLATPGEFSASLPVSGPGGAMDWLAGLLGSVQPTLLGVDGAVVFADAAYRARRRCDFTNAHVTELKFSDLDAAGGKRPFTLGFKWQGERVEFSKASGALLRPAVGKRKLWLCANFRLQGLPFDSRRVIGVRLPTVAAKLQAGVGRKRPRRASISLGDLVVEVGAAGADDVLGWVAKVIADGQLSDGEYFDLHIDMLDASLSKTLGTIALLGCGLLRVDHPKQGDAETLGARFTLRFSVERFDLSFSAG